MAILPSEMVGHSPFLPDPAAAYGRRWKYTMENKQNLALFISYEYRISWIISCYKIRIIL